MKSKNTRETVKEELNSAPAVTEEEILKEEIIKEDNGKTEAEKKCSERAFKMLSLSVDAAKQRGIDPAHFRYSANVIQQSNGGPSRLAVRVQAACNLSSNIAGAVDGYSKLPGLDRQASITTSTGGNLLLIGLPDSEEPATTWPSYGLEPVKTWVAEGALTSFDYSNHICPPSEKLQPLVEFKKDCEELEKHGLGAIVYSPMAPIEFTPTQAGIDLVEEDRAWQAGAPLRELQEKHVPQYLHCNCCHQDLMQTTVYFDENVLANGKMFDQYGVCLSENWPLAFGHADTREALTCPGCENGIVGADGFLLPNMLNLIR